MKIDYLKTYEEILLEVNNNMPSMNFLKGILKNNLYARLTKDQLKKIKDMYIVGSYAKGTYNENSDIDIAVIMEPIKNKTSLQFTEYFHSKYKTDKAKPKFNGKIIDFQFFWTTDNMWKKYSKIKII